jgi:tRNA pseudouridine38-40 synthase
VHALEQVAAFSIENPIPAVNLRRAMNRLLPHDIRILRAEEVAPEFHPRYDARSKTYEYRIFRAEVCPPFERRYVHHHPYPLDAGRMLQAATVFEGEHDFTAFAASDERDKEGGSKVRTIFSSEVTFPPDRLVYRVRGSGFLKHMVRNIVGTLLEVGKGNLDAAALLRPGVTVKAGPTAPACGLFLVEVEY